MMFRLKRSLHPVPALLMSGALAAFTSASAQGPARGQLTIQVREIVSPVSPTLYGLMTEEINHSYEGGLYGELVQNRSFHPEWNGEPPWDLVLHGDSSASKRIDKSSGPSAALPFSMQLTVTAASAKGRAGLTNPGFWGYGLQPQTTYKGSLYARVEDAGIGPLHLALVNDATGKVLAETDVVPQPGPWKRYEYSLHTGAIAASINNHLELTAGHAGKVWLQSVSLMQPTFHNRPNGNRIDLMQRMAAMHPAFLRLPGGNYLEGTHLEDWYDWKKTVGPLVERPGHASPWGYWSTDGFGLLEFLTWCEDLKIEPVLAVYAGYALDGHHVTPGPALEPFVQSALDEIEYVAGGPETTWGAKRARDGHPAPFPLHYVEIGNEDYLDRSGSYPERYAQFAAAIRKRYPQYKLISTDGNSEYATKVASDVSDEHYYKAPHEMMDIVHQYDKAPRNGPKIFVGEWATRSGTPTPNFGDALGDAAWMTGMERNSDLIVMASYAPLLVNVSPGGMEWPTDLIGFNAGTTYASPSYWAQVMFASHLGTGTVRTAAAGLGPHVFYSATVSPEQHTLHLKLVNASDDDQPLTVRLPGVRGTHTASITSLHGTTYNATNSIEEPDAIHPVETSVEVSGESWELTLPALTVQVIDLPF